MKNYTLLQPFHFIQEPKPEKGDFDEILRQGDGFIYNTPNPKYEEALQSWKEKYVEPEYDWVSFEDTEPNENAVIYFSKADMKMISYTHYSMVAKEERQRQSVLFWCDKESHDKKLDYYNYHKVLFPDFHQEASSFSFYNADLEIYWDDNGVHISSDEMSYWNKEGITISQFKSITELKKKTV